MIYHIKERLVKPKKELRKKIRFPEGTETRCRCYQSSTLGKVSD
jgi:hypothetical protein